MKVKEHHAVVMLMTSFEHDNPHEMNIKYSILNINNLLIYICAHCMLAFLTLRCADNASYQLLLKIEVVGTKWNPGQSVTADPLAAEL